jgi:hypothetical protein
MISEVMVLSRLLGERFREGEISDSSGLIRFPRELRSDSARSTDSSVRRLLVEIEQVGDLFVCDERIGR